MSEKIEFSCVCDEHGCDAYAELCGDVFAIWGDGSTLSIQLPKWAADALHRAKKEKEKMETWIACACGDSKCIRHAALKENTLFIYDGDLYITSIVLPKKVANAIHVAMNGKNDNDD